MLLSVQTDILLVALGVAIPVLLVGAAAFMLIKSAAYRNNKKRVPVKCPYCSSANWMKVERVESGDDGYLIDESMVSYHCADCKSSRDYA